MTERWVKATFSTHDGADLDPAEKGKPCWVNMAHITRIRTRTVGTFLEVHVAHRYSEMGPFVEPPSYFIGSE